MRTIWKYPLQYVENQPLRVPMGAKFLTVQIQDDEPCLWALIDTTERTVDTTILIYGTGHPIPEPLEDRIYIGTFQSKYKYVFHVFEYKPS